MVAGIAEADTHGERSPGTIGAEPRPGPAAARATPGRRRMPRSLLAAAVTAVLLLLAGAGSASASTEIHDRGPSGTADITLRPSTTNPNQLMLIYHFVNTDGAFAGRVDFSPVGFAVKTPSPNRFVGSQVRGVLLFPYTPGTSVSVGVHVLFVTADGSDETNSLNPYVVTYPQ